MQRLYASPLVASHTEHFKGVVPRPRKFRMETHTLPTRLMEVVPIVLGVSNYYDTQFTSIWRFPAQLVQLPTNYHTVYNCKIFTIITAIVILLEIGILEGLHKWPGGLKFPTYAAFVIKWWDTCYMGALVVL